MSDETTLLPCPFCGGEAYISDDYSSKRGMVYSVWHDCPAGGDYHPYGQGVGVLQVTSAWFSSREEAIAEWNTRAYLNPDGLPVGLTISDDGNLLNWRGENYVKQGTLGNGTLTAEQVLEAIEEAKAELLESCEYVGGMGQRKGDVLRAFEKMEQAIADELNAELGGEICEWQLEHSGTLYDKWRCSKCGFLFVEPRCDQGYTDLEPNFCPNCGKVVKR